MKTIGERIRDLRTTRGLTLAELGAAAGVNAQSIYKYESGGTTNIPLERVELLAKALEVSPCYLAGWEEATNESPTSTLVNQLTRATEENKILWQALEDWYFFCDEKIEQAVSKLIGHDLMLDSERYPRYAATQDKNTYFLMESTEIDPSGHGTYEADVLVVVREQKGDPYTKRIWDSEAEIGKLRRAVLEQRFRLNNQPLLDMINDLTDL